jgi:sulfatase modifying factor 1
MRIGQLSLLLAVVLAACNSLLGNIDHHLVDDSGGTDAGPTLCRLNSNCADGDVCIFQTCGPPCNGDQDCDKASRCLKTDTGTACVSSSAATCDAGCPAGTTCSPSDGACRNACSTTACLAGQTCTAGLCVGSAQHEGTAESGAGGAESGSGGEGGTASDQCVGVTCDTPPVSACDSPAQLTTYDKIGSCSDGACSYVSHAIACTCQSDACTTDPCIIVTCASPPAASCKDPDTLTTYASSGTCSEGSCSYAPKDKICDFGCANAVCKPDPCLGVACNVQPAAECKDKRTKTTYAATGSCSDGTCTYAPSNKGCDTNQDCGGAGVCSLCKSDASCGATCAACGGATPKCQDLGTTSKCVGCLTNGDCSWPTSICNAATNACEIAPSCKTLGKICGPLGTSDCCASSVVTGGTFKRSNDDNYPATVGDFRLDTYEITVSRFRKFVAVYSKTMIPSGAGKNPNNPSDPGWDTAWNAGLDADADALKLSLKCYPGGQTWTDTPGTAAAESLPINCLTWYEAEAFCVWDGGRLPTEAEWNYAAAGGTAQRVYPWGSVAPDCAHANYYGLAAGTDYCVSPGTGAANRVGSESPKGDGIYGQADLAGNVLEWVQDYYANQYPASCDNCSNATVAQSRLVRGGAFYDDAATITTTFRGLHPPALQVYGVGARCARSP